MNKCTWCKKWVDEELNRITESGYEGWFCQSCLCHYVKDELNGNK